MRVMTAGAAALVTLVAAGVVGAAPKTMKCRVTTDTDAQGMHVHMESQIWVKGDRARIETNTPTAGQVLLLVDGPKVRTLFPARKLGFVRDDGPRDPWQVAIADVPQLTKGAKKLGTAEVDGHGCDIYERTERTPGGTKTIKAWITRDTQPRVPLHVEQRIQIRQPNVTMDRTQTIRVTALQLGVPIPDSLFTMPAGYKLTGAGHGGTPPVPLDRIFEFERPPRPGARR